PRPPPAMKPCIGLNVVSVTMILSRLGQLGSFENRLLFPEVAKMVRTKSAPQATTKANPEISPEWRHG
ncbi:MAG: hypothetical protein ACP5MD_04660, partial [Verrucomicrobiia bacterium]